MTYSEIVNKIQNDTDKAADLLVDIAIDQQNELDNIKTLEAELQKANNRFSATMKEIEMVCKHVKKQPHFHITKDKKYYHFNTQYQVRVSDIDWEL